jgi:hypothetical protein
LPIALKHSIELLQFPESYDSLGSGHSAVSASTILHAVAVDTRCRPAIVDARACFVTALVVDVLNVKGMDMAGEVAVKPQLLARCYHNARVFNRLNEILLVVEERD